MQVYNQSLSSKRSIHRAILNGTKSLVYYKDNPRMVPRDLNPVCHRMPIAIPEYVGQNKRKLCSIKATDEENHNKGTKRSTGLCFCCLSYVFILLFILFICCAYYTHMYSEVLNTTQSCIMKPAAHSPVDIDHVHKSQIVGPVSVPGQIWGGFWAGKTAWY